MLIDVDVDRRGKMLLLCLCFMVWASISMELEIGLHELLLCLILISLITVGIFNALVCFFVVNTVKMQTHVDTLGRPGPWGSGLGPRPRVPFVPHSISSCTDLKSAAAGGWTFDSLSAALAPWQNQCINGVYDMEYWSAHGPFDGVFEIIRKYWRGTPSAAGKGLLVIGKWKHLRGFRIYMRRAWQH